MTTEAIAKPTDILVTIPGLGPIGGTSPIVVIGPNGAGKSRLMRRQTKASQFVSAQRRTYLNDRLPSYATQQATNELNSYLNSAHSSPWEFSNEIDSIFSRVLTEHYSALYKNNKAATKGEGAKPYIDDTTIEKLERFWESVFANRKLSFSDFTPTAYSNAQAQGTPYPARSMSDGERSCLYLAARILTAESGFLVIDEPELHMHKKLAVDYWNTLETMRPDLRFVYITHDLHFALSRKEPVLLVVRDENKVERVALESLPNELAEILLGAATLAINARRIIFFEGVSGKGLAHSLFKQWITSADTAAIGVGNRDEVIAAGTAFSSLGIIANAEVISIVDRDHGPEDALVRMQSPATVLALHEIESLLALPEIVVAISKYLSYDKGEAWQEFLGRARNVLEQGMAKAVAQRVHARFDYLLHDSFTGAQILPTVKETSDAHRNRVNALQLESKIPQLFVEEENRIREAMGKVDHSILTVLSGKQAFAIAAAMLGIDREAYGKIVLDALGDPKHALHSTVVAAMTPYLPPRA